MDLQNRAEAGSDGHDESVLNPEMPNETDLTKKERRRIEREKLKGMGTGKKIQYIWMYYKIHMLCVLLVIGGVCLGVNIYRHAQMKTVLSIAVVNAGNYDSEKVEEDVLKTLGTEDKYAEVSVAQNLMTDETGEDFDYYARIAYVTEIQSATVDILISMNMRKTAECMQISGKRLEMRCLSLWALWMISIWSLTATVVLLRNLA